MKSKLSRKRQFLALLTIGVTLSWGGCLTIPDAGGDQATMPAEDLIVFAEDFARQALAAFLF